ncbi:DUF6457 domain-containing protein [Pseudarthrobacter sp. J75]|uniref:DUF6457 domain-containing protein n=1 Tax=unclassified Pseudarthrobacter TaxID=2647000 RepID=UPI002E814B64|nr:MULTISPECIES: DUF6457 domain-containing protein [unclassified Pseudarthrobacter]MEE2523210.1 DUF6457 domain-containing protein [Pseudarthrobacter sp. J47]MEE2527465.1 DUF6457 domain-containing protein [Pseudarthrobacter sp. J75]MEE2569838.1 DUF6457 domain-containing protein [Pseudarthrobacter sp. J64]
MKTQDQILEEWSKRLLEAYELEGLEVDINAILSLAGVAAHSIVRPAAPLTTFIAGYAAGKAAASGQADEPAAMAGALDVARQLAGNASTDTAE